METVLLRDLVLILLISMGVILICFRMKIPPIVGFLLTGALLGPGGLGVIREVAQVTTISEIGLVLLLFTVGLEFSLKRIFEFKRAFLIGGALQVIISALGGSAAALFIGRPFQESVFWGVLVAMSSTAIVMKLLQERRETATPHGRTATAILIFQDLIAIPFLLVIPLLTGHHREIDGNAIVQALLGILFLALVFFSSVKIIPKLLDSVTRTRSRELFILTVLGICFGVAWLSSQVGLSLTMGAFLAGLAIADSEYSIEAIGDIIPFKDVFTSLFFVSIGMLADLAFVFNHPFLISFLAGSVILVKLVAGVVASIGVGLSLRYSILVGFLLAHVGEFSFVLAKAGADAGLGSPYLFQLFLDVSIFTMALVPPLSAISEKIVGLALKLPLPHRLKTGSARFPETVHIKKKDHVIIVGFGIPGRNLARSLKEAMVPYIVIEMNPDTVKIQKENGEPIFYGDASHETTLFHAGILNAKAIAVVVNDIPSAFRIVETARKMNPYLYVIVRCHRVQEMKLFVEVGANDVIPDEFGTSIEVFTRVLKVLKVNIDNLDQLITEMRLEGYELLRQEFMDPYALSEAKEVLGHYRLNSVEVPLNSFIAGKTIYESAIRSQCGVSVLLIKRKGVTLSNIIATTMIEAEDILVLMGAKENLMRAKVYIRQNRDHETDTSFSS